MSTPTPHSKPYKHLLHVLKHGQTAQVNGENETNPADDQDYELEKDEKTPGHTVIKDRRARSSSNKDHARISLLPEFLD